MFSELASHNLFLLLKYLFVVVLFHSIKPAQHNLFGWLCVYNEQRNMTTGNLTEHFSDFTQGECGHPVCLKLRSECQDLCPVIV